MKIVRTDLMPGRKLAAINLFGIVFAPKSGGLLQKTINHEAIHSAQMKEMLFILFYLWYACLLYTSDAADDLLCVDLGGRRIIKKKNIVSCKM